VIEYLTIFLVSSKEVIAEGDKGDEVKTTKRKHNNFESIKN